MIKNKKTPRFKVKLAETAQELHAAKRLRYDVFVSELGGAGDLVDHHAKLEQDGFDPHCDHLLLIDPETDQVIGVYRLMRDEQADGAQGFYSEGEYDLTALKTSRRRLLELGRSCLHPDYRGGTAMHSLWNGLAKYVAQHEIEILFGVASFHGTNVTTLAQPLSFLHHHHLAPAELRPQARAGSLQRMDLISEDALDRRAAMAQIPSLIKAYIRLGGMVGEGAFIDHAFNTTDVCLILDTTQLSARNARIYGGSGG